MRSKKNKKYLSKKKSPQDIAATNSEKLVVRHQSSSLAFSGPIPPPEALEKYEHILPGAAERILSMAEKNNDHNIKIENRRLDIEIDFLGKSHKYAITGQFFGLLVTVMSLCCGTYIAL